MNGNANIDELKIFTGTAHPALAGEIAAYMEKSGYGKILGEASVGRFNDGEVSCQILENVRGSDVFVIQPTSPPANENLMELLIMIDALKRASAARITAVLPYYGYGRQDRKDKPRVPISAKLVADLISAAGANRVLTMDLHAPQIQGFFNIPVDHLFASPVYVEHLRTMNLGPLTIVSPDAGGVERARAIAKQVNATLAIIDKRRASPGVSEAMNVIGDVEGKTVLIVDDIIDTAGTLIKSADALHNKGATQIYACGTHGLFSGPAIDRIESSVIQTVLITNTIPPFARVRNSDKFRILTVAPLLGEAIIRIYKHDSVNILFSEGWESQPTLKL